jgi:hypothetical protein
MLSPNFLIGAGNRPDDLLIWRATFEHAFIKNIRIKEIETPAEAHPSVDILLEFTHSGSPRGEKDIKPKGTKRLQQGYVLLPADDRWCRLGT